ncbi:SPRY domain-containing protein 3 [Polyrhizophydium stewartii]|uniref:SPRY domain-containing protein 3 n=1 Tax=Polyrhizophydium stewartii TaxID=2732419 RepID=A0ABR4NC64_9FUNG|nr:Rsp5p-dependent ubiquitination, sorting of cargo proteins at the multivesicular body [Polyrhizophydium stewartii]
MATPHELRETLAAHAEGASEKPAGLFSLASELVLCVADWLDPQSLRRLAAVSAKLRKALLSRHHSLMSLAPRFSAANGVRIITDVSDSGMQLVAFRHSLPTHRAAEVIYDSVEANPPGSHFRFNYRGVRRSADSVVFSKVPLAMQHSLPHLLAPVEPALERLQVVYFEVSVLDAVVARNVGMSIGLIDAADISDNGHPPGATDSGVSLSSYDGWMLINANLHRSFQGTVQWGPGDTVGCGYAPFLGPHGCVFFTLNGHWVVDCPKHYGGDPTNYRRQWHAAFSSTLPATVAVNLGSRPFALPMEPGLVPSFLKSRFGIPPSLPMPDAVAPAIAEWRMVPCDLPVAPGQSTERFMFTDDEATLFVPPTVLDDGTTIHFVDNNRGTPYSVLSTLPIGLRPNCTIGGRPFQYFEARALVEGPGDNSFISVGLAAKPYGVAHQIGWLSGSIGYHSDDGRLFHNNSFNTEDYEKPYSAGSVVGCGFCPETGAVFFTRDGVPCKPVDAKLDYRVFAAVAAIRAWHVSFNFGLEPFVFDLVSADAAVSEAARLAKEDAARIAAERDADIERMAQVFGDAEIQDAAQQE